MRLFSDAKISRTPDPFVLTRPDDWHLHLHLHLHLRDGVTLTPVLPFTARSFGRAIVMPKLRPPVTTATAAVACRKRILSAPSIPPH